MQQGAVSRHERNKSPTSGDKAFGRVPRSRHDLFNITLTSLVLASCNSFHLHESRRQPHYAGRILELACKRFSRKCIRFRHDAYRLNKRFLFTTGTARTKTLAVLRKIDMYSSHSLGSGTSGAALISAYWSSLLASTGPLSLLFLPQFSLRFFWPIRALTCKSGAASETCCPTIRSSKSAVRVSDSRSNVYTYYRDTLIVQLVLLHYLFGYVLHNYCSWSLNFQEIFCLHEARNCLCRLRTI